MFAKAVELDPLYARAYAGMADCDSFLRYYYHSDISTDSILAFADKALSLDEALPEAHASRGFALLLAHRPDEAVAEFERAIALMRIRSKRIIYTADFATPREKWRRPRRCSSAQPRLIRMT